MRDYLTISAMEIIPIGIANEVSALQQTYGITSPFACIFIFIFICDRIILSGNIHSSDDGSLRKTIRKSTRHGSGSDGT